MTARRVRSLCLMAAVALSIALDASAQTTAEGRVIDESTVIWRSDVAAAFATAPAGTSLRVTAQSGRWYEVIIPESLGGRGERGLVARAQLRIVGDATAIPMRTLRGDPPAATPPALPRRADIPPPAAPAGQQARARPRGRMQGLVSVNGIFQVGSADFSDTVSFPRNAEQALIETTYAVESLRGFGAGAAVMVTPRFGVGASVERVTATTPATLTGTIPHPFFFAAGRNISAEVAGLERDELALHGEFRAAWPVTPRLQVSVLGGPSLFRVRQGLVSDVRYTESYPYDTVRFDGADSVTVTESRLGFNVGGEAAFFFSRHVGVGVKVTMSRAVLKLPVADDHEVEVEAGGLRAGAGVRFRF